MASIKKQIAKALGKQKVLGFKTASLTITRRGVRTVAELAGGTNPTSSTYTCKALLESTAELMDGTLVAEGASKISILGGTLPEGVVPVANASIVLGGKTYKIVRVVSDPVDAMHDCEVMHS